jgi:hypothetical protein
MRPESKSEQFVVDFEYRGHTTRVSKGTNGKYSMGYDRYFFEKSSLKALQSEFENYIDYMYPASNQ